MDVRKSWWDLTGCGSRYIENVIENLAQSNSVCLVAEDKLPWDDYFYEKIKGANISSSKAFESIDSRQIKEPGEYLFSRYCSPDIQSAYWPENPQYTHANFLAECDDILLNHRFLFVRNICTEKNLLSWHDFVVKYNKSVKDSGADVSNRAVFILEYFGKKSVHTKSSAMETLIFQPREVDILTYNLMNTAQEYTEYILNKYAAELIGDICSGNIEKCGYMAEIKGIIKNPIVELPQYSLNGSEKITDVSEERVYMACLSAQFKVFFPLVEQMRREIIYKYCSSISNILPWRNDYGEIKNEPYDLELRDLIFKAGEIGICEDDKKLLRYLREIRNQLAHNHTITYEDILNLADIAV